MSAATARKIGSSLFILVVWQILVQTGKLNAVVDGPWRPLCCLTAGSNNLSPRVGLETPWRIAGSPFSFCYC